MSKDDKKISLPANKPEQKKGVIPKPRTWPGLVALLSLILAIVALGAIAYLFKKEIAPQKVAVERQATHFQGALSETHRLMMEQQQMLNAMQAELKQYQREVKAGDVYLSEAEYLVRLAMFNLTFQGNTTIAYQLIKAADEKVHAIGAASVWPIRQALARDMVAINAVPKVDLPGLVSQLNALSDELESLPRASEPDEKLTTPSTALSGEDTGTWKEKLHKTRARMTEVLGGLFVISRDVPEAAPLLPPDQYTYVITNIQSKLSMAEWAALYRQPEVYEQSLSQAAEWVDRYFAGNNSQTVAFIKSLDKLAAVSIKPELPDLSNSLKQIALAREEIGSSSIESGTSMPPEEGAKKDDEIDPEEESEAEEKAKKQPDPPAMI